MKVIRNSETDAFLKRCLRNMQNDRKNAFVGRKATASNEHSLQMQMKKAGFAEYQSPQTDWPSLFLSAQKWEQSPYHSHVHLDQIRNSEFRYETELIQDHELFNADEIQPDPLHELNDSMILRAMDSPCNAVYLYQGDEVWMMDAPSEAATNDRPAARAEGNVLTFGLGIGYYIYMAMQNPKVTSITAVESSQEVIDLFLKDLYPQFPHKIPVHIIHDDAFHLFHASTLQSYDSVYADIWQSSEDGLQIMERLLGQDNPDLNTCDFWIENSCLEPMWALMFLVFDELAGSDPHPVSEPYQRLKQKIRIWADASDEIIDTAERLKFLMYDRTVLRRILALSI